MANITLGVEARDKITGFTGIVTARIEYLYGCTQYSLVHRAVDNKKGYTEWFDEGRVEAVGAGISAVSVTTDRPGGEHDTPSPEGRRRQ